MFIALPLTLLQTLKLFLTLMLPLAHNRNTNNPDPGPFNNPQPTTLLMDPNCTIRVNPECT